MNRTDRQIGHGYSCTEAWKSYAAFVSSGTQSLWLWFYVSALVKAGVIRLAVAQVEAVGWY